MTRQEERCGFMFTASQVNDNDYRKSTELNRIRS